MEHIDLQNLNRVWDRIQGEQSSPCEPSEGNRDPALLRSLIEEESYDASFYTLLAIKTRGRPIQRTLLSLKRDGERCLKRLQTEYFLLTGDTLAPRERKPSAPYLLPALRDRWQAEERAAARFAKAAEEASSPSLKALFLTLAEGKTRRAETLRAVLEKTLQ